ncbi:unnamed protein product [Lampetra planeri]
MDNYRYYGLYDTADREGQLKKYHKDALITIYSPSESSLGEEGTDKPTPEDSPQLKCERLTAEDFIKELTHKHHDMSSFTTTVSRGTDTQVNFTVHGFFKEIKNCQESVKIFWRVVQLVPTMDGRCLERNNWNFSKAADYFIHLDVSTVPPAILTDTRNRNCTGVFTFWRPSLMMPLVSLSTLLPPLLIPSSQSLLRFWLRLLHAHRRLTVR